MGSDNSKQEGKPLTHVVFDLDSGLWHPVHGHDQVDQAAAIQVNEKGEVSFVDAHEVKHELPHKKATAHPAPTALIKELFHRSLALTTTLHTKEPSEAGREFVQAPTPKWAALPPTWDDHAIRRAAEEIGIDIAEADDKQKSLIVEECGETTMEKFDVLARLHYSQGRKVHSFLLRAPWTGKIVLLVRGADSFVLPRIKESEENTQVIGEMNQKLDALAMAGQTTFMYAYKYYPSDMPEDELKKITSINFDHEDVAEDPFEEAAHAVEQELDGVLGVVGIETIYPKALTAAMKHFTASESNSAKPIWLITKSKRETAVTAGCVTGMIDPSSCLMVHWDVEFSEDQQALLDEMMQQLEGKVQEARDAQPAGALANVAVIMDQASLLAVLSSNHKKDFLDLSHKIRGIVVCRVDEGKKSDLMALSS